MVNKKSLIIIGGGITGLSTGLAWVKNVDIDKKPVIIIEKQPIVGGYVTSYKRGGFLFDTTQIIPDVNELLEYFNVKIDLIQFKGYYARIFVVSPETGNVEPYKIPSSVQGFEYHLMNRFPGDTQALKKFFSYSAKMYDELFKLKYNPGFFEKLKMLFTCKRIILNSHNTFEQYFNRFKIKSPQIKEIFNVFAAFSGLPFERVSALLAVSAMLSTLKGAYRPKEGFIQFPQKIAKQYTDLGGEILTKTKVEKIIIENNRAIGVKLENGEFIYGENIVTTIDPKVAMKELVGQEILKKLNKKYSKKVDQMKMSASSLHIGLGLDDNINLIELGLNCGYNVLTTGKDAFEKLFKAFDLDKTAFSSELFHCAVIAPSLATNKKNTIIIRVVPVPAIDWIKMRKDNKWLYDKEKEDISEFFIALVEKYLIPGLSKHILIKNVATPATFARYSGSPTGSNYDMAPYPNNFGMNRLPMITPVKNLYQPKFSNGIWPSVHAGLQVTDHILNGVIMNGYSRFRKK